MHGSSRFTKKRAVLGTLGLLIVVAAAVAYFTTAGEGEGSATVGTSVPVEITAEVPTTLYPGTSSAVTFEVNNPSKGHQYVNTVSLEKVEAFEDPGHEDPLAGCKSAWFTMAPVEAKQDVPGEATTTLSEEGELKFVNENESQDACKGAYLVATFISN
jgi:hypothetical protein